MGIDLGTTFSVMAHVDTNGKPEIIPNAENERLTPSVILFDGATAIVGNVARQNAVAEPEKVVDFVKREMGKSSTEFHREFGNKIWSAEELSALILKKLKQDGEKFLGESITDAVITVPSYFNDIQRTATLHAGKLAGFNVLQILNEPTAAALVYGIGRSKADETVFVFDLGGGTFDVTIMRITGGHIQVLGSSGDHQLGGKDWDDVILHWASEEFESRFGEQPMLDVHSYQDLYGRAVAAKIQLSLRDPTPLVHHHAGHKLKMELSREEFENRSRHLIARCKSICEIALHEAKLSWPQIDRVLLTGGSTRIPSVRKMITEISNLEIMEDVSPDEAVAMGAALQGTLIILKSEEGVQERTVSETTREELSGQDGRLIRVTNITTHTLGIILWDEANQEEYVFPMIRRSTPIPAEMKDVFGTARAGMKQIQVRVVEGESTVPAECTPLGVCTVELPPSIPQGSLVTVTYRYCENQVLDLVVDAFGKKQNATITRASRLTETELEEATAHLMVMGVE